jgi:hypothetical protein
MGATIPRGPSDPARFVAIQSPSEARRAAIIKLENRVSAFRADMADEVSGGNQSARGAVGYVLGIIEGIPNSLPLPRPMLLSSQVSLHWDKGDVYAEVAVSGDGNVSVYAKHPKKGEVLCLR